MGWRGSFFFIMMYGRIKYNHFTVVFSTFFYFFSPFSSLSFNPS